MTSRSAWYYADLAGREGPISWDALLAAVQRGQLSPRGLVWAPGVDDWVPAGEIPWLFGSPGDVPADLIDDGFDGDGVAAPPPLTHTIYGRSRQSTRSPIGRRGQQVAPVVSRALAALIDLLIVVLLTVAIGGFIGALILRANPASALDTVATVRTATFFVLPLLYHVAAESFSGTTIGKRVFGLMVVDAAGETPFASRIVVRSLVRYLVLLALIMAIVFGREEYHGDGEMEGRVLLALALPYLALCAALASRRERRMPHDRVAGTWVVRRPSRPRAVSTPQGSGSSFA